MGYYEVYLSDGVNSQVSIFDAGVKELALLNAVVSLGVNEAGSFEFTIPPQHVFYNNIIPYGSSIEVRENNETIFFGRPLPPTIDFWGNKKFHCEGALAFLNDVYLPPVNELSDEVEFNTLMDMVLGQYNKLQIRYDRQFAYDTDNFPSTMIYDPEEWDFQSVLDYIRNYMHQFVGGYFYAERQGGLLELKWRQKLTDWSNQPITFGANLLEIMRVGQPFYTAAIAKGGEDIDGNLAAMTTPYVASEEVRMKYGTITAYLDRPSATVVDALEAYCEAYLEDQQFNGVSFEISAADQHLLNGEYDEYRVGQQVHVISPDQDVDVILPITQIKVDINSAVKKVTVGDLAIMPITISQKKAEKEAEKKTKETAKKEAENVKEDSDDSLVIKGADGNDYEISVDENGEVIATKIPKNIKISPSSKEYKVGDSFSLSDFTVTAYYGDGTTKDVTSDCTYSLADGYVFVANDPNYQLRAVYTVAGKSHAASARLIVKENSMPKEGTITINGTEYDLADWADIKFDSYFGHSFIDSNGNTVVLMDWIMKTNYPQDTIQLSNAIAVSSGGSRPYCYCVAAGDYDSPTNYQYSILEYSVNGELVTVNRSSTSHMIAHVSYDGVATDVKYTDWSYLYTKSEMYPEIDPAALIAYIYFSNYPIYNGGNDSGQGNDSESGGGGHF